MDFNNLPNPITMEPTLTDCAETILGCMSLAQWGANLLWALVGGLFIYGYLLWDGINKSATTPYQFSIWMWLGNPKNWLRILINTLAIIIIIRLTGPLAIPTAIGLGLSGEAVIEIVLHKFRNPLN